MYYLEAKDLFRVLVEVDVSTTLSTEVTVNGPDGEVFNQPMYYEWALYYYSYCSQLGHKRETCKRLQPKQVWVAKTIQHDIVEPNVDVVPPPVTSVASVPEAAIPTSGVILASEVPPSGPNNSTGGILVTPPSGNMGFSSEVSKRNAGVKKRPSILNDGRDLVTLRNKFTILNSVTGHIHSGAGVSLASKSDKAKSMGRAGLSKGVQYDYSLFEYEGSQ